MDASSSPMDVSPDPVSLRAAALSTLKLKRRKLVPEKTATTASSRPTPASDFQLDYGQEDVMAVDLPPPPTTTKFSPKSTHNAPIIAKDVQMREEGEISDEEEILRPAVPPGRSPPPPPSKSEPSIPAKALSPEPAKLVEVTSTSPLQKSLAPEERAPPSLLERFSGYAPSNQESENDIAMSNINEPELDSTLSLLGPDRVRPGLLLTMDEYDTAKDIILDLLGWGVPPDFLVDCGLSKELVFYVFSELNLRLPDNFDFSGIIPYTPEFVAQLQQYVLPPPTLLENSGTSVDVIPRVTTPPLRPPTVASSDSPSNTNLHDMERQRRQELLARKAVQASRRLKQFASIETHPNISPSDSSSNDKQEVTTGGVISTEVIEDFLNSIGPVRGAEHLNGILPSPSEDDQAIYDAQTIVLGQSPASLSSANTDDLSISPLQSHGLQPSSAELLPTSTDSATSTFPHLSEATLIIDSSSQLPPPRESGTHPRRGVRPVASDFVDFDTTPQGNESKSRLELPALSSGIIQRLNLAANFRDIGSRRCVIDLSDSEDEDELEVKQQVQQSPVVGDQLWLKRDRRSKASNYQSPASIKSPLSGNQSPAALMMKELEIRRMRELIAKREEETRLKKLAFAKNSVNIDMSSSSSLVNHIPTLKQEDFDVLMSSDSGERNGFGNYRSSESATPPPRSVSKSPDDENDYYIQADPNLDPSLEYLQQDFVCETQEAQVVAIQEQEQLLQQKERYPALRERMVDADPEPSPSTQANQKITLATPKQDANELVSETPTAFTDDNSQQDDGQYGVYDSIFELYPLLHSHSRPDPDFSYLSSDSSSHMYPSTRTLTSSSVLAEPSYFLSASSSSSLPEPNLRALKLAALGRTLHPFKQICRYEIPGGGTCRDEGCGDTHLSRFPR